MARGKVAAKVGRAACPHAAEGGVLAAKNAKSAKAMKPSGIPWIGDIPEGWRVMKLRRLGTFANGISKGGEFFGKGNPFVCYSDVYKNEALPTTVKGLLLSTPEEQERYSVKTGDVFFTRTSETIDEIGFSATCLKSITQATFAGFLIRFRPSGHEILPCFSKYYFRNKLVSEYFAKELVMVTRASLGQELLKSLPVLLPPLAEQKAIADYLDEKCAAIDAAVAEVKRGIEEYKAWKKSLIFEMVTGKRRVGAFNAETQRGGGAEKMKPSGIPWIGDIPEGWEVSRVKEVATIKTGNTPDKQYQNEYYSTDSGVPWIKAENLGFMVPISQTAEYLTEEGVKHGRIFPPRTVFVCCIASIGKVGYSEKVASCNQQLNALAFNSRMYWKYGFYVTIAAEEEYLVRASGNVVKILNSSEQGLIALPLPPLAEQKAIADYLDEKCAAIDAMVAEKEALIADLEAYKKSLIFEVVTGKREVA